MTLAPTLDRIHHVTINVANIESSVAWYQTSFACELLYRDKTHAILKFQNICLELVLPSMEQPHLAFPRADADTLGELRLQKNGSLSTYLSDPTGNIVEIVSEK